MFGQKAVSLIKPSYFISVIVCILSLIPVHLYSKSIVLNSRARRLGDNLDAICKAAWIAHHYSLHQYYLPFYNAQNFQLHTDLAQKDEGELYKQYPEKHYFCSNDTKEVYPDLGILYMAGVKGDIAINWHDDTFLQRVRHLLSPITYKPNTHLLYPGHINIALHLRTGEGFDKPEARQRYALRFPNVEYYVAQLKKVIVEFYPDKLVHVHVFTDDPYPEKLVQEIRQKLGPLATRVTFSYRNQGNHHDKNVIEDFFDMTLFDVLIRSGSLYSYYAWILGNHTLMICPKTVTTCDQRGFWEVDKATIIVREPSN